MNKLLWLALGCAVLWWQSCSCPPSEQTGELALGTLAKSFFIYDGTEVLVFQNEMREEERFRAPEGQFISSDELCYRTTCTEASFGSPSSCEFVAAESERYTFFNEDNTVVLDLLLFSDVYDYGTDEFYDAMQAGFSFGTPSISGIHLLEPRFTGTFEPETLELMDVFEEQAALTLNDKTFTNVHSYEDGSFGIYIEPGLGVIGFKTADHTWVLQD